MAKRAEVKFWLIDGLGDELQFLAVLAQVADLFSTALSKEQMARVVDWLHDKYGSKP